MIDDKYHSEDEEKDEQSSSEDLEDIVENEIELDVERDDHEKELEQVSKIKKINTCVNADLNLDASFYSNRILEVEQLKKFLKKDSNHGLTGIKNLGNSCYINTIIQCLSHTLDFSYFMISNKYSQEINNSKTSEILKKGLSKNTEIFYLI